MKLRPYEPLSLPFLKYYGPEIVRKRVTVHRLFVLKKEMNFTQNE